ncbi:hypothetical protein PIROE2DRAFT_10026 [Piromyces sp. E2]|nr:hypothetical protein PIROE2DRAFT_10026 [Piromyces sp. E2]|eukprot:OUM63427.1 hypothetical protein PIROE2DRAFT_10026 [Piromyces sp. E2]
MDFNYLGVYSFEDIKSALDSYESKCTLDSDCPPYFNCDKDSNKCILPFYCSISKLNCSYSTVARNLCNNNECNPQYCNFDIKRNMCERNANATMECISDSDCLSNHCVGYTGKCINNNYLNCLAGNKNTRCGFVIGHICEKNEDCLSDYCRHVVEINIMMNTKKIITINHN